MSLGLDDLIITKNSNNETICGGFKVNNLLLNSNNPALITMNSGKKPLNKVSSLFDDLAVPAGLLFISEKTDNIIDETLYDKLFNLARINSKKQSKRRLKINTKKSTKNKTSKRR